MTLLQNIPYVPDGHERQVLDLYLPDAPVTEARPLVVWIHGGGWRNGSKDNAPVADFIKDGFIGASITYRLSKDALWPAQIQDCKAAIRWLRYHAGEYGIDPDRIGVWGPSAGGHLVAMLGTTGDYDGFRDGPYPEVSDAVQAVVNFYGPTDILRMNEQAPEDSTIDHDSPGSPEGQLVGGPIQEAPYRSRAETVNPIRYITGTEPPMLHVHGTRDTVVPHGQSIILHEALAAAGVDSTLMSRAGAGHGDGIRDSALVQGAVLAFFREHLGVFENPCRES
ncbi:MAG: alpha/beta hydrolase fold domain-containing protein [Opitutales bacterium]